MSWPILFTGIAIACFGLVFLRMGLNALAAADERRAPEQHEHVAGDWQ
jgi:hypothetical protein